MQPSLKALVALEVDDYDKWKEYLQRMGVEPEEPSMKLYSVKRGFLRDPFGNLLEIVEWLKLRKRIRVAVRGLMKEALSLIIPLLVCVETLFASSYSTCEVQAKVLGVESRQEVEPSSASEPVLIAGRFEFATPTNCTGHGNDEQVIKALLARTTGKLIRVRIRSGMAAKEIRSGKEILVRVTKSDGLGPDNTISQSETFFVEKLLP